MCSNLMVKKILVWVKNNVLTFLISLVEDKKNFDWTNCFNQFVLCISCKPNCKIYRHVSFAFRIIRKWKESNPHLVLDVLDDGADLVLHLAGHQLQLPLSKVQPAHTIPESQSAERVENSTHPTIVVWWSTPFIKRRKERAGETEQAERAGETEQAERGEVKPGEN